MKCPHCGKEMSDFAIKCPNCGGNPKEQATKEVKEKIEIHQRKQESKANKICLIACLLSAIVGLFTDYVCIVLLYTGINKTIENIIYTFVIFLCVFIMLKHKVYKHITKSGYILFIASAVIVNVIERVTMEFITKLYVSYGAIQLLNTLPLRIKVSYYLGIVLDITVLLFSCFFLSVVISNKRK